MSEAQVQGAVAAAQHLLAEDMVPLFDHATLRAMWKAGHREIAERLAR